MHQQILDRLKAYKTLSVNNRLTSEEKTNLMILLLKAIAPPVESVLSNPSSGDDFEQIDAFDNISDEQMMSHGEELAKIFTEVSMAIGSELGKFLYRNNVTEPSDEIMDTFYEEMGFPPKTFNKGMVISHMYCMELLHQGYDPIPAILNMDNILKSAEKSLHAIMVTAGVTRRTLEENDSKK
jgi:hypothetical protein